MGCGESKQAVATDNTLTKIKSKSKDINLENNLPVEKPVNDDAIVKNNANENVGENGNYKSEGGTENPSQKNDEEEKDVVDHGNHESTVDNANEASVVVVENIKEDVGKDDESKGGDQKEKLIEETIDDHHEDKIESIISEGISGKSDYYHSKGHVSDGKDGEEDGTGAKLNKLEKEDVDVLKVDEGIVVVTTDDETKSTISAGAEIQTADASPENDVKAN